MSHLLAQINGIPTPGVGDILHGFLQGNGGQGADTTNGAGTNFPVLIGIVVSQLLLYAIVIAGLIFFVKLLMAGFSFLSSGGDSAKVAAATKNLTNATIGLVIVIVAFFIAQILQVIFGIKIL